MFFFYKAPRPKSFGVDTSSTVMGAGTTSLLKDLEHRNACVGLAGNNLEPHRQWEARTAGNSNTLYIYRKKVEEQADITCP